MNRSEKKVTFAQEILDKKEAKLKLPSPRKENQKKKDIVTSDQQELAFSPFTLKIRDAVTRVEYQDYQRSEVLQRTKYLLYFNYCLCFVVIIAYLAFGAQG